MLPVLPTEILWTIIDYAQCEDILPKAKWLKNYSLISRSIGEHAQQLLFKRVVIKGVKACEVFKKALTSGRPKAYTLRMAVRTFVVKLDHQEIFGEAIALCPHLRELDVGIFQASFRPRVLQMLRDNNRQVKVLKTWSINIEPVHQLIETLSSSIARVSIDLRQLSDDCKPFPFVESPVRTPNLSELRIRYLWYRDGTGATLLRLMGTIPPGNLTILHMWDLPPLSVFQPWLDSGHAANLRSLQFRRYQRGHLEVFQYCSKTLQELQVMGPLSLELVHSLPPSLVHLSFYCAMGILKDTIALGYVQNRPPKLRVLTYNWHTGSGDERRKEVQRLNAACRDQDIEFRFFYVPLGQFLGEDEPMIDTDSFPRHTPVSKKRRKAAYDFDREEPVKSNKSVLKRIAKAATHGVRTRKLPGSGL